MKKIFIFLTLTCCLLEAYSQTGAYFFLNGTTPYTSLTGASVFTINGGGGTLDDGVSAAQTIPFTFNFAGTDFTQYVVCSNGFIAFGSSLTSAEYAFNYNAFTGTRNSVICFNSRDLNNSGAVYSSVTEGNSPDRIHKIECANYYQYNTTTRKGNCQIWLYEGSNKIEIRYGSYATTWTSTCRVGLRGNTAIDIRTLNGTGPTAWTSPVDGTSNASTMNQANPVNADNGRMYTYYLDNSPMSFVSSVTTQNVQPTYQSSLKQQVIGVQIVTTGTLSPLNLTDLNLSTNGSTNAPGDIANAKVYYTGTSSVFSAVSQFGAVVNSPSGAFSLTGNQQLASGTNYFWVTYDITAGATIGNVVDAECSQIIMSGAGGTQVPVPQAPSGTRAISNPLGGVNVGTGQTYTSLTNAGGLFEAINNGSLQLAANLTAYVTSDLSETGNISINQWPSSYTLTISPADNIEKLISGASALNAMILLNGADKLVIDGRFNGSGRYLRFRNTDNSRPVLGFANDATLNTIRDCIIESNNSSITSSLSGGVINFGTTNGPLGNDSNAITNCDIRSRSDNSGRPANLVFSRGNSSSVANEKNSITNCNLINCLANGILIRPGSEGQWYISGNNVYNENSISTDWNGISIDSVAGGTYNMNGNNIGGNAPGCSGQFVTTGGTTCGIRYEILGPISINANNNRIAGYSITNNLYTAFYGIGCLNSYSTSIVNGNITGNYVGDTNTAANISVVNTTGNSSIVSGIGIKTFSGSLSSNIIAGVKFTAGSFVSTFFSTYIYGIVVSNARNSSKVDSNKIGSFSNPASMELSSTGQLIYLDGMYVSSDSNLTSLEIKNNTVTGLKSLNTTNAARVQGVLCLSQGLQNNSGVTIANNNISRVTGNVIDGVFALFQTTFPATTKTNLSISSNIIEAFTTVNCTVFNGMRIANQCKQLNVSKNIIRDISFTGNQSSSYIMAGMYLESNGVDSMCKNIYSNNFISLNKNTDLLQSINLQGIYQTSGDSTEFYDNTIYLGGVSTSALTSCYYSRSGRSKVKFVNNLFYNNHTSAGSNYAVYLSNTVPVPDAFNYNTFITPSASALTFAYDNGTVKSFDQWKLTRGYDKQSWNPTVAEIPAGNLFTNIAVSDFHINANNTEAWVVSGKGIALSSVNSDFDGNPRSVFVLNNPPVDIGADEFSQTPPGSISAAQTGTIGAGNTTSYKLWGRDIAQITWGSGGTSYPASMDLKYFTGIQPPEVTGNYEFSYYQVTPSGSLSGAQYDISLYFGDNETYSITSPSSNTRLAKHNTEWTTYLSLGNGSLETELDWANLKATVRGLDSFSDFALIDVSAPLPVTISSFTANTIGRDIRLVWKTEMEINNSGFDIERAAVSPGGEVSKWLKMGFIRGSGTTNEHKSFTYDDSKLSAGKYKYRLKQIDYNGHFEYYNLSNEITIGKPAVFSIGQNYPNPSNPKSKIDFQMPFDGKVSIRIYDILGREVAKLIDENRQADYYSVEFDGSNLASGIYFYRILAEGEGQKFVNTKKMVLVK